MLSVSPSVRQIARTTHDISIGRLETDLKVEPKDLRLDLRPESGDLGLDSRRGAKDLELDSDLDERDLRTSLGDLLYSIENGEEVIISNDQDKANVLCNYFSSVFNNDLGVVTSPSEFVCSTEMEQVLIDVDDVKKCLSDLNVLICYFLEY